MAERFRACVICGHNSSTLHILPKKEELRKRWLDFIYGNPPPYYNSHLVICSKHFEQSDFTNYGAYSSGFASKLSLKPGSVPSRRSTTSSQPSTSETSLPPVHTSTQTDPPSRSCRATQLSMGTQTESTMTGAGDAPWGPGIGCVHPRPCEIARSDEEEEDEITTVKVELHDPSYDSAQSTSGVPEPSQLTDTPLTEYTESKCIVFEKNLMELFETCPVCNRVSEVKTYRLGTFLSVKQKCHHCNFSKKWNSQPENGNTDMSCQYLPFIYISASTDIPLKVEQV
uniref:THAP domain-containing protein 1 n=1 Tax=Nothobranchius pienaari TaxID=704102 RepID=A0A1A8M030_9TELE